MAQERYQQEVARRQQQQFQAAAVLPPYASAAPSNQQEQAIPLFASSTAAAQQAAEYERLNQAHLSQQQREASAQGGGGDKSSSSEEQSSSPSEDKSVRPTPAFYTPTAENSYYMALPYPTQHLTKSVTCQRCNCRLYTSPLAKRFYCQTCCSVAAVPFQNEDARFEEKMQDVEDVDYAAMTY